MLELKANMAWPQNRACDLPKVVAEVKASAWFIVVRFEVEEPEACYRAEVRADGGPCFKDSCVEIFLETADGAYRNFEFNSLGKCLSAKGRGREARTGLTLGEYANLSRKAEILRGAPKFFWTLEAKIPASLGFTGRGNLYKCADLARTPHYLSLFEVRTAKPDFHRPEFFGKLF